VKAFGWKSEIAIGPFGGSGGLVPFRSRKGTRDRGGDGALLSIMIACTSRDAMGNIVVELSRDRPYGWKRGSETRVVQVCVDRVVDRVVVVIIARGSIPFSDRFVYSGQQRIKAWRDSIGLDVSRGSQKGKRVSIDVNKARDFHIVGHGGGSVLVGRTVWVEQGMYVAQVDENAALWPVYGIRCGTSARNSMAVIVVNQDLSVVFVEQRKVSQVYGTTIIRVRTVKYSLWILSDYRAGG